MDFILIHLKRKGTENNFSSKQIVYEDKTDYLKCTPEQYGKIKKRMQETVFLYYSQGITLHVTKSTKKGV